MMNPEQTQQHEWLQKLVGEWTCDLPQCPTEEDPAPEQRPWTDTGRAIGGLWVACEGRGEMPGGTATTIMTLGYDPARGKFVGTFIGSMMTHQWIYEGDLEGDVLTLDTEGPDFENGGKMAKFKDIIEFKSDNHRTLTSLMLQEDGEWKQFMHAEYHRKA